MSNRISVLIDVATDRANRSLSTFRQSIKDTEGAAGKMKVGLAGAMDFAKANAASFAMAAGAALVTFGAKSVTAFQDTALAAGELRDKLGLTAEDASKFIEVAGDMGIPVADLESTIGRMNRTAASTPGAFDAIGASIARNQDGTINVRDTFLSAVEALNRMPDAAARAQAGQQIFGRSWMNIAEMVQGGAGRLSRALDGIEAGKIIDDEEIEQAKRFRDALDEARGSIEEFTVKAGGAMVPVLTDVAEAGNESVGWMEALGDRLPWLATGFGLVTDNAARMAFWPKYIIDAKDAFTEQEHAVGTLGESITNYTAITKRSAEQTEIDTAAVLANEEATKANAEAVRDLVDARNAEITATMESGNSSLAYRNQVAETSATIAEATMIQADGARTTEEQAQAARDAEGAAYDQADAAVRLAEDQATANGTTLTAYERAGIYRSELQTLADKLNGPARDALLAHIATLRTIPTSIATDIQVRQAAGYRGSTVSYKPEGAGATGGIVNRPTLALIGEAGPEAVIPLNRTAGNGPLSGGLGGATFNVTIQADPNPDVTVRKLREWVRRNGPIQGVT